jgi:hypothetical protein
MRAITQRLEYKSVALAWPLIPGLRTTIVRGQLVNETAIKNASFGICEQYCSALVL